MSGSYESSGEEYDGNSHCNASFLILLPEYLPGLPPLRGIAEVSEY